MRKLADWTAEQLIFLDESAANERTADRKYGWAPVGSTPHEMRSLQRSERWSILPAYTVNGFMTWDIRHGSYTAALFEEFIENKVLPMCNPFPGPRSVIIMDNAPIHQSKVPSSLVAPLTARGCRKYVMKQGYCLSFCLHIPLISIRLKKHLLNSKHG